jgi:hypothetical protein
VKKELKNLFKVSLYCTILDVSRVLFKVLEIEYMIANAVAVIYYSEK